MNVLIVEDDPITRRYIRGVLRSLDGDVHSVEAADGAAALEHLAHGVFDLLLVDWNVPRATGLDVLRAVRCGGSQVPAIMVTSNAERQHIVEALAAGASDYLVKPFSPESLREKVRKHGSLPAAPPAAAARPNTDEEDGSSKPTVNSVLTRIDDISTLPQIAARVIEVTNDPNSTATDLQAIIEGDPALSVRVLRYANSPACGLRQPANNLQQAIVTLGIRQLRNIALTASVSELFRTRGSIGGYRRSNLWRHMVAVAICARMIAKRLGFGNLDDIFLAGLLHDIGIILEDQFAHQTFCKILRALDDRRTFVENELDFFSFDHTVLGERIAERWHFPKIVQAAIRYHHASMSYEESDKLPVRCVELANALCSTAGMTSVGVNLVRDVDPAAMAFSLTRNDLPALLQDLRNELVVHASLFQV
jgi:putative nucleotidyltransferase with HDIG domain